MELEPTSARLRAAGLRATPQRVALIAHLASLRAPQSIQDIAHALEETCDQVTVYRMIDAFAKAGIVREVNIHGERPLYELTDAGDDHHHLVCTNCRKVEDFVGCDVEEIIRDALTHSRHFSTVTSHSFDLYGLCTSCAPTSTH